MKGGLDYERQHRELLKLLTYNETMKQKMTCTTIEVYGEKTQGKCPKCGPKTHSIAKIKILETGELRLAKICGDCGATSNYHSDFEVDIDE